MASLRPKPLSFPAKICRSSKSRVACPSTRRKVSNQNSAKVSLRWPSVALPTSRKFNYPIQDKSYEESSVDCQVCRHPRRAEIVAAVQQEHMSIEEGARTLGVSKTVLWRHLRFHEVTDADVLQGKFDSLEILCEIASILRQRLQEVKNLPAGTLVNERILELVTRNLRQTIMDIEQLTGRLRTAPLIQLQQVYINYEKMLTVVLQNLCPDCQRKVRQALEVATNGSTQTYS